MVHFVVRCLSGNPGLDPAAWVPVPGFGRTWTARGPDIPPIPEGRWRREFGAELEDLPGREIRRRYELLPCPPTAIPIGRNQVGEEIREADGLRWIVDGSTEGGSWRGAETAHPPARALRFGARRAWRDLADHIVNQASRGQLSLSDDELSTLAARLVDPGRRPSFQPWTRDAVESRELLISELRAGVLVPAVEAARPLWAEATALERAIPALSRATGGDPSLAVAAATAAVAGALRQASLQGSERDAAWSGLFGGTGSGSRVIDGRRLSVLAAASEFSDGVNSDAGRITCLLPGDPDQPDIEHALREAGRQRGLEAILHLPPEVLPDEAGGLTLVAAGGRRPAPLADPPPQAMRVIRGEVRSDLRRWLDEALRGRSRLAGEVDSDSAFRQAPYVPLSRIGQPRCTIARSHQVAASEAGRRLVGRRGPVDRFVAGLLGTDEEGLADRYSPEQVDAIAMAEDAHLRGRAFLLADQTGTGKGRAAAGMATAWLRRSPAHRVVYVTVGNVPGDVVRDLRATGALEETGRPLLLGSSMPELEDTDTPGAAERANIHGSRGLPDGTRFVVCSYSSLNRAAAGDADRTEAERRAAEWFVEVANDPAVMVILDEAHNAVNPASNLGRTIRSGIQGAGRVAFVTATAMRSTEGADLYRRLMPAPLRSPHNFEAIQRSLDAFGETAQESFVVMLTEDGVMLRRDHDTGLVPYRVDTPSEAEDAFNREVMAAVAAVAERMLELNQEVRRWYVAARAPLEDRAELGGQAAMQARRQLESMMTGGFGGPLDQIARAVLVTLKIPQVVRLAATELNERNRKPMIAMSSTAGGFLRRIHNREIPLGDRFPAGGRPLDLRDFILQAAARVTYLKGLADVGQLNGIPIDGDSLDLRVHSDEVAGAWVRLRQAIEAIPAGLPVSPVDALRDALADAGITSGEITGREHQVDARGEIVRREIPPKHEVAAAYNSGELDVLLYNAAGGTGASYHASPDFADQRPRTILQLELPLDVLQHLQSLGRGNRFDQVALPEFVTCSTDTVPEQRLLAANNRKLRRCGAILDGDRDHPAVARGVPDIFNALGEEACRSVIRSDRGLAARLDLDGDRRQQQLAKSIFTRALLLPRAEQERVFDLIVAEYEALLEAAESRGDSPLKVPSLDGYVEIAATEPWHTGNEALGAGDDSDGPDSAFSRPLQLSTGIWRRPPGLPASAVRAAVLDAAETGDGGGAAAVASGRDLGARWEQVSGNMGGFRLRDLVELLETFEPGRILTSGNGPESVEHLVAVEYLPAERFIADHPYGHRFRCIGPGDGGIHILSAAQLLEDGFRPMRRNILDDDVSWLTGLFDMQARTGRQQAVQMLTGDMLSVGGAIGDRGSRSYRVCTFVDQTGRSRRAAVNSAPIRDLDLRKLPFRLSASSVVDAAVDHHAARFHGSGLRGISRGMAIAPRAGQERTDGKARANAGQRSWLINLSCADEGNPVLNVTLPSLARRMRDSFWSVGTGPEIFRAAAGHDYSDIVIGKATVRNRVAASFRLSDPEEAAKARRLCALLDNHPATDLLAPGPMRGWWRERGVHLARDRKLSFGEMEDPAGGLSGALERGMNSGRTGRAVRADWPGGEVVLEALPDNDRAGAVVSLPAFDRRNEDFWAGEDGRRIWEMVFKSAAMPDRPPQTARPQTVFLSGPEALELAGLIDRRAVENGWDRSACAAGRPSGPQPGRGRERQVEMTA